MSQATIVMPTAGPLAMAAYSADVNAALAALASNFLGTVAPSTSGIPVKGLWWVDSSVTPHVVRMYDGSTAASPTSWPAAFYLDIVNHGLSPAGREIAVSTGDHTLALVDSGKTLEQTAAVGNSITIPTSTQVAFPVKISFEAVQIGAGQTTFVLASTAQTLRSKNGAVKISGQYGRATLYQRAINDWVLSGDIST